MSNKLKPIHGVGNGPGSRVTSTRRIELFRQAGIQFSRTSDPEGRFGSGDFINIHCIFKNFDADVNDEKSYDFQMTDIYIKNIIDAGTKVFYRLGETIENGVGANPAFRKYCCVPKDMQKWAEICEHIIMHYNEGWANGFHYNIEYWEIWNEPDNVELWDGTAEDYFELYRITANHLKNRFPNIKIGGYGSSGLYAVSTSKPLYSEMGNPEWYAYTLKFFKDFIEYVTNPETKAPLDFFSWHAYRNNIGVFKDCMQYARSYLDSKGLTETESILNEWNLGAEYKDGIWEHGIFRKGPKAAAFVALVFAAMNKNHVDKGMYYDAEAARANWCGLFDNYKGEPCKPYYVFKAYNELYEMENVFDFGIEDDDNLASIGAEKDGKKALLISNYRGVRYRINISGEKLEGLKLAEIYTVDDEHDLELTEKIYLGNHGVEITVNTNSTLFIKFS